MEDDRAAVRLVDRLILNAVERRASDIHLEPAESAHGINRLRLRIDGLLTPCRSPEPALLQRAIARIKLLAGMDVADRRLPQDGRVTHQLPDGTAIHLRASSCPAVEGEKLVLRLVESEAPRPLPELGMPAALLDELTRILQAGDGLILVTGPTGSGKSATLQAALSALDSSRLNICTVEDPVERSLPGVTQVSVNRRSGLDFATTLRAFLRQDPDVLMVGEIRDAETAAIAVKAAQTGHLVLSTLHTRSAEAALERLQHLGVPAYDVAASIRLVIAQRLLRTLCPNCCTLEQGEDAVREAPLLWGQNTADDVTEAPAVWIAVGCPACQGGYRGRHAIFQGLPVRADLARRLRQGESPFDAAADSVTDTLHAAAGRSAAAGHTTVAEIRRVLEE